MEDFNRDENHTRANASRRLADGDRTRYRTVLFDRSVQRLGVLIMYIFEAESKLLNKARTRAQRLMATLAIASVLPLGAAIAIQMPRPLKALAMSTSLSSAIALLVAAGRSARNEKAWDFIDQQQQVQYERLLEMEAKKATILDHAALEAEILELLEQLPLYQAKAYAEEWGAALETNLLGKLGFDEYGNWMGAYVGQPAIAVSAETIPEQPAIAPQVQMNSAIAPFQNSTAQVDIFGNQSSDRPIPSTSQELLERLRAECPVILKLIKSVPIRLVGTQRTGKSTFARILVLLRMLLIPGHSVAYATPHFEEDNPVPPTLRPFGCSEKGKDYPSIEKAWANIQANIDQGKQLNMTVVWDEFGGYDAFQDADLLGVGLRSLLRESTKHGYHPILVAHGDQAMFYPGVKDIMTTLKSSTVKVETVGTLIDDFGTMAPTGKATVTWLDGTKEAIALPSWLKVDYLLSLLPKADNSSNGNHQSADAPASTQPVVTEPEPQDLEIQESADTYKTIAEAEIQIGRRLTDTELKGIYLRFSGVLIPDEALPSLRAAIAKKKEELHAPAIA